MTQDEKQILIAKHLGWKIDDELEDGALMGVPPGQVEGTTQGWDMVPDYFVDLNACHDMEKHLGDNAGKYFREIQWLVPRSYDNNPFIENFFIHAPAAYRAEAFGRTLNLWT